MRTPDVRVTIEGGVAQVDVFKSDVLVEVRDFDVEGADANDTFLWTNEEGDLCRRYFVGDGAEDQVDADDSAATDAKDDGPSPSSPEQEAAP